MSTTVTAVYVLSLHLHFCYRCVRAVTSSPLLSFLQLLLFLLRYCYRGVCYHSISATVIFVSAVACVRFVSGRLCPRCLLALRLRYCRYCIRCRLCSLCPVACAAVFAVTCAIISVPHLPRYCSVSGCVHCHVTYAGRTATHSPPPPQRPVASVFAPIMERTHLNSADGFPSGRAWTVAVGVSAVCSNQDRLHS